jgi:predicted transglutaminase-like cysteine proteinase
MKYVRWFVGAITLLSLVAGAQSVREAMHTTTPTLRNTSFQTFLKQHGKTCVVSASEFGAQLAHREHSGDVWSVRCKDRQQYAVFIGSDAQSTSWFMPCAEILSNFQCFKKNTGVIVFK